MRGRLQVEWLVLVMSRCERVLALSGEPSKWCAGCLAHLTFSSFHRNKKRHDGKATYCVRCCKENAAARKERVAQREANAARDKRNEPWMKGNRAKAAVDSYLQDEDMVFKDTEKHRRTLELYLADDVVRVGDL